MGFKAPGKEGRNDLTNSGNTSRRKEARVMKNLIPWIKSARRPHGWYSPDVLPDKRVGLAYLGNSTLPDWVPRTPDGGFSYD